MLFNFFLQVLDTLWGDFLPPGSGSLVYTVRTDAIPAALLPDGVVNLGQHLRIMLTASVRAPQILHKLRETQKNQNLGLKNGTIKHRK